MIEFTNTLRGRPIVLTSHQIKDLAQATGWSAGYVGYVCRGLSNFPFEVKTLGGLMKKLPDVIGRKK